MKPQPGLLIPLPDQTPPHRCDPPGEPSLLRYTEAPEVQIRRVKVDGALWLCGCGRYWHGQGHDWWPISERRARRLLKKAHLTDQEATDA